MGGPWEEFKSTESKGPWSDFSEPVAPVKPSGFIRKAVGDKVLGFASGAVGATKALADAAGAGNVVSDTLESANTGINDYLSPEEKASQRERSTRTEQAKGTGAWNEFKAGAQNFAESPIQQTIAGAGSILPVALAALGGLTAAAATGVGMGVGTVKGRIYDDTKKRGVDAGLSAQDAEAKATKAQDYTGENADQIALGGGLGALDALTGVGRIAGGALRNAIMKPAVSALPQAVERGMLGRAAMGALGEVPLEAAQGGQEQLATNIAAQRQGVNTGTWDGVVGQATEEGLASLGMGAGVGALHTGPKAPGAPAPTPETPTTPSQLQLGNTPDPYLSFADGTVGRRSEVDAYINALPADQQPAARAKIMGMAPQPVEPAPVKPSEAMGLNADAGPLSAAAVVAVDTGAHQPAFDKEAAMATYRAETEALRQQQEAQDAAELEQAQRAEQDQAAAKTQAATKAMLDQATAPVYPTADELFPAPAKPEGSFITKAKEAKAKSALQGEANGATDTPTGMAPSANEPASSQPNGGGNDPLVQRDASGDGSGRMPTGTDGQSAASRPMVDAGRSEAPVAPSGNSSTQEPVAVAKKEQENQPLALEPLAQAATETVAKPVTQPAQPVMSEGAGGSQPTQVAPTKFTLDPLNWDAGKLSSTYSMEQLNTLHGEVKAQFSNKTVSGSPVDERGMATEERLNADGQKMESALKKAIGVVYEKSKGAAPPKPKTASKADLDHLFGVDQKRAKAVERIAKGTAYFSLPMKAQEFIAKNGLKETHQSVKTSRGWDVVAKDSQPKGNTSVTKTTEAITPAAQQQAPERAAGPEVADHIGRDNRPLSEGGKPFKTKDAAAEAKKLQPMLRVVKSGKGFALAPKTDKQLAAEVKTAKRMSNPQTSPRGEPIPAHAFIASEGGLHSSTKSDMNMGINPRVGNRTLFAGQDKGLSMERATARLIEEGYLPEGASQNDAAALIKRSLTKPQFTAAGTEAVAQSTVEAQYEDYLATEQDAAQADDFDPFGPLEDRDFLTEAGYDKASPDIQAEFRALISLAEASDIDAESIQMDVAAQVGSSATNQKYHEAAITALKAAIEGSNGNGSAVSGIQSQAPAGAEERATEGLTAPTSDEILAQQARAEAATKAEATQRKAQDLIDKRERERKDIAKASEAAADTFVLGGDAEQNLSGQGNMFDEPAPAAQPTPKPKTPSAAELRAKADLQAALADLGDIFGRGTRLNMMPEQEAKILPVMVKLFDAAFRLGYIKFKDAAKFALDKIRAALGAEVADDITLEHLQGAYISMSSGKTGVDGIRTVSNIEAKSEIESHTAQTDNERNGESNVSSTNSRVERNSPESGAQQAVGNPVSTGLRGADPATAETGGRTAGSAGSGRLDGIGLSSGGATAAGERSDQRLPDAGGPAGVESVVTGADFREPGGDSGITGVPPEPIAASQVGATADASATGLKAGIERARANKAAVKLGDIDSIRATLPQLLPGQQDDVKLAEDRFAKDDGYGVLFTNGTGTGKTFSGLGIIKRHALQGKTNTLILAPDTKIASDWIKSGKLLGLDITELADTKDAGKGIVITTYANFGANDQMASRKWDLVVADEAHTLMQDKDGTPTTYLHNLRAITGHPDGAYQRFAMLNRDDLAKSAELRAQIQANTAIINNDDTMDVMRQDRQAENARLTAQTVKLDTKLREKQDAIKAEVLANQGLARPRLGALSATPFAYEKTIDWANGYLFDYNEGRNSEEKEFRGYNVGSNREQYFMQHFGYRMRTGKLTSPEGKVDSGLLQRQWNGNLKKSGALSGRMLDVAPDYDRRFVTVDSAIGNRIDEAIEWVNEQRMAAPKDDMGFSNLAQAINDQFKYQAKRYLLEAIKADAVIPIVKQHLAMGRKVVVFHDYKKGGGFNPFRVRGSEPQLKAAIEAFNDKFSDLVNHPFEDMDSPIEVFKRELPQTMLINGDEKKADLLKRYEAFQDDGTGPQVMLVQSAKNKGWSGHDTTGKHQRVLINLGQPTAPTLAIQQEGRIYRTGQASDAIMRYLNTGTNWERWTFASTIAGRASTAENLGMGEMARALKDSFIQSFEESDAYPPGHDQEGKGGKERDKAANDAVTEYDRAKTHYWATQKKNSRTKAQEGIDYFATPEPLGLKMVQWLDARPQEDTLEPSAGHGAIARWLPDVTQRTVIEPSLALRSRLALVMNPNEDRIIAGDFESLGVVNKFDGIVMNPPFGTAGRTAVDHLAKAATHLRDGGRIVALLPTGPAADKKFDKWFYESSEKAAKPIGISHAHGPIYKGDTVAIGGFGQSQSFVVAHVDGPAAGPQYVRAKGADKNSGINVVAIDGITPGPRTDSFKLAEGLRLVATIKLPQVTFERAGTAVATRIVVIEKSGGNVMQRDRDLSDITDINELFDKLENMDFAPRSKPVATEPVEELPAEKPTKAAKPAKVVAHAGDEVTIGGKKYEVEIYTTNAGKEKRGVWMASRAEASKYSSRAFTHSSNKGKWFVDEFWFPKDAEISKPDAAFSRKDQLGSGSAVNWTDSKDQSHAAKVAVAIEKAEPGKPAYDYTIVEPQGSGKSRGNRMQAGEKNISDALDARVREFERAFGRKVIFVRANGASPTFFNGFILPKSDPNTIYVNTDTSVNLMSIIGHEFYEGIAAQNPTLHAWFVTEAVKHLGKGALTKYSSRLAAAGDTQDIAGRFKELLADFTGDALADPLFRQSLNDASPSRFKVLIRSLMVYLQKVLNRLTNTPVAGGLTGDRDLGSSEYFKDIQALRDVLKDVIKQADSGGNLSSFLSSSAMFSRKQIVGQTSRQHTPEQLRAMANVGFQVEVPSLKERAQALWKDAGKKLAQGIVDQFAPVKAMDGSAYGLLRLAKGASGAFESFLHGGQLKLTDGVYDFDEVNKGGVIEKLLMPLQGEHHDFMRWVAANRAERLTADGKENLFSPQDIADLKTLASGTAAFDYTIQNGLRAGATTRDRAVIYRDSLATFNQFNKNILDMAEQSGLIDGPSRQAWEHEFYVPFYRVADEATGGVRGMSIKGSVIRQQAFKQLKGGKNALNADLLDNTLMNWAHLLDASAKNRAAKATIEAAERLGIAAGGNQSTLAQMGTSINNKNGVVWFMDGGQKRYSLIDNQGDGPYLMTALGALEYSGMRNPVMDAMGTMKRVLTIGVTASPFFKIRNLIRDSVQVLGTSGINANPLANVAQGWKLTDPKSDAYFRLLAGGGAIHFGTMTEGNEAKRVQALVESGVDAGTILGDQHKVKAFYRKFIEPGITAYNELGNRGEAINRAALYDQLVKQGMSHADASLQARDLMDFSMQGSFTTIRFLTQVVPFFNARIQGLYKLGRAAKEDPARFSAVLGATAMFSIALLAAYGDDDDWKKRTESDRNNFWWFKFGGTAFRIPKPFEIGAIATLAERGFELAFDKEMTDKRFMAQVTTLLGDNLSMNPIPQLVKPIVDVYANKDSFSGRPIETMGMDKLKSEYRFNDRTSMMARGLSTAANAVTSLAGAEAPSPVQIDHMLRGYFGWLGSFVVGTGDLLARPASGQPDQATPDYWKNMTGNMVSDLRDAPSRYVSQMYTQAKEIEQAHGTWKSLQKEGKSQEASEFARDNQEQLSKYRMIEGVKRHEASANQRIRMVERSNQDADTKRELIRNIQVQKDRMARAVSP